jgi:hypothetical protein
MFPTRPLGNTSSDIGNSFTDRQECLLDIVHRRSDDDVGDHQYGID